MNSEELKQDEPKSAELKPCPFCGGRAENSLGERGDGTPWPYVECVECGASTEPHMWNRRADPAPVTAQVDPFEGLPSHARYIAFDQDGEKCWYSEPPELRSICWAPDGGDSGSLGYPPNRPADWRNSLVERKP